MWAPSFIANLMGAARRLRIAAAHPLVLLKQAAPFRLGIQGRLLGAFIGIASLTGVAGAVALISYDKIEASFQRIELEGFPVVKHALKFAREAADYASAASTLQDARDLRSLNVNIKQLDTLHSQLRHSFSQLSSLLNSPDLASALEQSVAQLSMQASELSKLNAQRIGMSLLRDHIVGEATVAHRQMMETLAPKLDDAVFELDRNFRAYEQSATPGDAAEWSRRLEPLAASLAALSELRAETHIQLGVIMEASLSQDAAALEPLRDRYVASIYRARRALLQFANESDRNVLAAFIGAFGRFDNGAIDVFEARRLELRRLEDVARSAARTHGLTTDLTRKVQAAVRAADDNAAASMAASKVAINSSRLLLQVLSALSLLLAIAFAWIYVGKGLLRRLTRLTDTILALARGNLDVAVPRGGHDELTQIAAAVEVFKKTAIEARDLEADKERARLTDLSRREASFRLLFEGNPVPMWVFDRKSFRFLAVNDATVRYYGYSREQFLAMTVLDVRPAEMRDKVAAQIRSSDGNRQGEETWQHRKSDGTLIEVVVYSCALSYEGKEAALVANFDITERKRAEERVAHMARHDALTNLPNRTLFRERLLEALDREKRSGRGVAVLALDLDRFKDVNDTLGHPVGDELLKLVTERLLKGVREHDCVARLGGDEFVIVLNGADKIDDEAANVARRLRSLMEAPFEIDGHRVEIGVTAGIALAPHDGRDPDTLLKCADLALYRAKSDGRGGYCFFEAEMDLRAQERRRMEQDLRQAIACGEFELHYQPLVNVQRDEVVGFEALLRWNHPTRGRVSPADFIPLAEETGLIVPIGEWVIRQACTDAAHWPEHLKVAVNLSPAQFRARNLEQTVILALAKTGLSARRLELEITETAMLQEEGATYAILSRLHDVGVRIALDDFGTGYSSLSNLRKFQFDKIKIDRSFVSDIANAGVDAIAILRSITQLGTTLGIDTTAEGVETKEQRDRARSEGCTEIQGYYISPALPVRELTRFLEQRTVSAA